MPPRSEIRLYRIEPNVGNRQKQSHRTAGELELIRGETIVGVLARCFAIAEAGNVSQQVSSAVAGPPQCSKFMETAFSRGRWPGYRLWCLRSQSLEAPPRLEPTRENSRRMGALRVRVPGLEKTWAVFNFIQTRSGRKHKLAAIRAAIARRPDCV